MKRRDLLKKLSDAAADNGLSFASKRTSGNHEVFDLDGLSIPIPRHREIAEGTARSIRKQAADRLGEEWWT